MCFAISHIKARLSHTSFSGAATRRREWNVAKAGKPAVGHPLAKPMLYRSSFKNAIKLAMSRPDRVGHLRSVFCISSIISGPCDHTADAI